jgi:hypothetical protein
MGAKRIINKTSEKIITGFFSGSEKSSAFRRSVSSIAAGLA